VIGVNFFFDSVDPLRFDDEGFYFGQLHDKGVAGTMRSELGAQIEGVEIKRCDQKQL
jgi:hypothetical protein